LFNQFGCDSILNILLRVHPDTDVFLGNDTTVNVYHNYSLDAGDGYADYSWNTGDTGQSITLDTRFPAGANTFAVRVTDQNGCINEDTISVTIEYPVSVVDKNTGTYAELYPNPATDHLSVRFLGFLGKVELQIINDSGQILHEMEFFIQEEGQLETLILGDIPAGNYFVRFKTDSDLYQTQFVRQE
jgi:hypothetical protein